MEQCEATVVARLEAMPGIWQLYLRAASLARAAQPGQFVMALRAGGYDPYLRCAVSLHKIGSDTFAFLLDADTAAHAPLLARGIGEAIDLLGPFGRGFAIAPRTRDVLLVAEGMGIGPLVALAEQSAVAGRRVTLLAVADARGRLYPTELLPRDVEYHGLLPEAATDFAMLLRHSLAWADQVCAAGSWAFYRTLHTALQDDPVRARPGFVQVWHSPVVACGLGVCRACAIQTRRGILRACTDGPVFDLMDLLG